MDESRKQFEQKIQHSYGEDYLVVNDDGDYVNWITADLWEFWQASRAAIEIELPGVEDPGDFFCEVYDTYKVHQAMLAAGIKVKGA